MNSEDRKGFVGRVRAWAQSRWLHPDGSISQIYLLIAVGTLVFVACIFAMYGANMVFIPVETLVLGLLIASLVKHEEWQNRQLDWACRALLDIAFQECCCKPNSIIIEAPGAPELVGKPVGKGYCHVCKSRELLEERFPGAIEELIQKRLNAFEFEESYIPEDLSASYFTPEALAYLRERRLDRVGPERFVPLTFTVRKLRK